MPAVDRPKRPRRVVLRGVDEEPLRPAYPPSLTVPIPQLKALLRWESEQALAMLKTANLPRPRWRSE